MNKFAGELEIMR